MLFLAAGVSNMNQKNLPLSAIIIARNEEDRLEECLASVAWTGEIIVVDNASTDETAAIAKKHNAYVVSLKTSDFSALRNLGLKYAHGDWVLYLDADERVTGKLQKTLESIMDSFSQTSPRGYYITRKNYYLGQPWPATDKMHRFFRRESLKGWRGKLHETALVDGAVGTILEPLIHRTHRTLEEMVAKTNEWSKIEALLRFQAHHPPVMAWRLIRVFVTGFWQSYIRESAWRAGTAGMIESIYQGFSLFITYAKLWELQKK